MSLIEFGPEQPRFQLTCVEPAQRARIAGLLARTGWRQSSEAELNVNPADLLIADPDQHGLPNEALLPPRLAWGKAIAPRPVFDDQIDPDWSDDQIRAAIDIWRPTPDSIHFHRVAQAFGGEALRPVARSFAGQLGDAITGLDAGLYHAAHAIAGLAGTLGFRRVSQAWIAIDEGDLRDLAGARREARLAQVALARWLDI